MKKLVVLFITLSLSKGAFSQNVGIGITTPLSKLHVKGTGSGTQIVLEENAGSILRISNEPSGTGPYIGTTTNNPLSLVTNNSAKLTISTVGNIGIGQPDPTSPLHFSNTIGNKIALWGTNLNHYGIGIQAFQMQFYTPANTDDFVFGHGNSSSLTETMRIKGNGNVGIGTATPEGALHLKSNNWIKTIFENNTGEPRGYMGVDNNGTLTLGSNAYWNGSSWIYPFSGSSLYMLLHRLNNRFEFRVRPDGGNQATAMTIDTGSNVSIGGNLVIDQKNGNTGTLSTNTLRFGNLSGEGIGSKRNSGTGQWGLDFYTNSINRMTVANNGNIGIGTISPQNTLDINGAIKIGSNNINQAGSIRYLNNTFEGYNGSEWNSFDQTPKGTLVGSSVYPDNDLLNSGYAYKGQIPNILQQQTTMGVSANTWLSTATQAIVDPGSRQEHSAVWTGTEMIVWGGRLNYLSGDVNDGARYNSELNLWTRVNTNNAPTPRSSHTSVWTGTEMIVWGGRYYNGGSYSHFNSGARYNPTSDSWTPTTSSSAPGIRSDHTAIWTGTEMIIWGGQYMQGDTLNIPINTGATYNPATNTWTPISTVNAPAARFHHTAIWTGTEMIIWGGSNEQYNYNLGYVIAGGTLNTGAKYNPATNTWTSITVTNAPTARILHSAVWSGTEMIIWGGTLTINNTGSRYNPSTNTWTTMSNAGASGPVAHHKAVWTGSNMLVWGGSNTQYGASFVGYSNVYTYTPASNSWTSVNAANPPSYREGSTMIWTGNYAIVFGGINGGVTNTGGRFFPTSLPSYNNSTQVNSTIYLYSKQ